jgi:hypothetical protein
LLRTEEISGNWSQYGSDKSFPGEHAFCKGAVLEGVIQAGEDSTPKKKSSGMGSIGAGVDGAGSSKDKIDSLRNAAR